MGAPKGNKNAEKGKIMSAKLRKRLEEREAIEQIADALITKAIDGDLPSIKEVFDRMDGKAPQETSVDFNDRTERDYSNTEMASRLAWFIKYGTQSGSAEDSEGSNSDMGSDDGATDGGLLH